VLDGSNRNVRSDVKNPNISIDASKNATTESKDKTVYGKRIIGNKYVIETLPSRCEKNNFNVKVISGMISNNNAVTMII